jgi:hypothetical protein
MIELLFMLHNTDIPEYNVPKVYERYERCVAKRESEFTPTAVNPTGKYRGMYQFDKALARGTTWHITDWLRTWHPKPKKYAAWLRATPMNHWPKEVQTAAFVAVLDGHDKDIRWYGKDHFAGGRWSC